MARSSYQKWLLQLAGEEPAEAINVIPFAFSSHGCGIEHVVFISDKDEDTKFDLIFSNKAGDPSYELHIPQDGAAACGVFTECLQNYLSTTITRVRL